LALLPGTATIPALMETAMVFRPNYNHQRTERARAKEQKKQEKRQRRDEEAARRKAGRDEPQDMDGGVPSPDNDDNDPDNDPANPSEDADGPQETTH
jgi:hypothetical protein